MSREREAQESLEKLEAEERTVSTRRRRLHERIEFLRGTGLQEPEAAERLAKLDAEQQEVSAQRRELHAQIDALRAELGLGASGLSPR
jgi:chromosome segregation ATPase